MDQELRNLLMEQNAKLDAISQQIAEQGEALKETVEIAAVFKEFGSMMNGGSLPSGVPTL